MKKPVARAETSPFFRDFPISSNIPAEFKLQPQVLAEVHLCWPALQLSVCFLSSCSTLCRSESDPGRQLCHQLLDLSESGRVISHEDLL